MGTIKYFGNKSWLDITREERFFCSHLYHNVLGKEKEFVKWLSEITKAEIDYKKEWDISFEVCFYRDLIKANNSSIKKYNEDNEKHYPQKRTFDLCLFSMDEMIIIEAKAQQGFTGHQLDDILQDAKLAEEITDEFGVKKIAKVVLLHSSLYHPTDERIIKFPKIPRFTWNDFLEFSSTNKEIFRRADKLYKDNSSD